MKKSVFAIAAACMVTVGALAGCGGQGKDTAAEVTQTESVKAEASKEQQETPAKEAGSKEKVVVTALIQQSRNFEGLQKMIQKLEEEENIKIDAQIVPDDESLNMIKMKLNSGECPDIIDYNVPAVYDIIDPASNFADMTGEAWTDRLIIPGNVTAKDGKIYGFPFLSVPGLHGFIYNKDVFDKAGVEVPATWDELLAACEKIKESGTTPIFMPKDTWVPQILMTDNFAKILGADGCKDFADKILKNETKWSDVPEFAEVLDKYLELYQKGYVNSNFASATYDDAIAAVADGTAAMHFNGDFFATSVLEANPEAQIGMFPVSMKEGADVITENMSSAGFVAYKNSENLDVVKKIFDLWSTPEYANLYFADRPAFPAFQGIDGGKVPDYLAEINENYIKEGKAIPEFNYYVMTLNPLFESSLYVYYVDAPAKGTMDGKAVMEKFQKDYEQYMKDQGAEGF
ncbi:carbohydrate ABC transporter substrate-binding protein [Hungatella sp. L12]|uniref:Carbohydrate ABC transporter substrate-binding protein n=1 Tax=Hungatella hominis TaxID=2763050 RepID=A0ABR7H4V5_9FIRM|nr:ABC transporter substrate-binding protein [Hungatella hominis]MBC5708158.1 carbohydrate ABC transporter substrate-binding protein [Hungatella hominis]